MLKIKNGIVTVNGIQTRNPELIGLAVLDSISNDTITDDQKAELKQRFENYVNDNGLRVTNERKVLINELLKMDLPNPAQLVVNVKSKGIAKGSVYNFINLCKEAEIIDFEPEKHQFNINLNL